MTGPKTELSHDEQPAVPARRKFLIGGAAAIAGAGAASLAQAATGTAQQDAQAAAPAPSKVTNAPESDKTAQSQPFYGLHQQGIVNPRPAAGLVVAFDVLAQDRAGLERLFRTLTERAAFLTKGGPTPELDPKFPPADSGILGPIVTPDNLTITVSIGASLFDKRFGLATAKPKRLKEMTDFPNDALEHDRCHGDLVLQFCSNTPDTNIHALRDIVKNTPDLLMVRWKQDGTVPVQPPSKAKESARNFLGFRDGTGNPDSTDARLMDKLVWVQPGSDDEPSWAAHGSYQAIRLIRNFVERWDRTPLQEQESIFGRKKPTGAPFDGHVESDVPNYAADPEGKVTRLDSHIRLANPRDKEAQEHIILRRPFNYSNGVTKSGQLDMGLMFIAYQADLDKGFIYVQNRLNGEPLEEYLKPFGGGYFFVLPGVADEKDFFGRGLLQATGPV